VTDVVPVPGPTDSVHDVPGIRVGQVELGRSPSTPAGSTGVTAVVAPDGAIGAVDVRGAAPGTRETDSLRTSSAGERVHAVLFVGRSVFGLAAADGATAELERRGIGHHLGPPPDEGAWRAGPLTVPIVAAAVLFDFAHGDPEVRPTQADGVAAVAAALEADRRRPPSGNSGAGAGAFTGGITPPRRKGGTGHASLVLPVPGVGTPLVVAALVVVNSSGSVVDPVTGRPWPEVGFAAPGPAPDLAAIAASRGLGVRRQTTLALVATNAALSKAQAARVATMAHDGLARAIRPLHSALDGDAVFVLAVPEAPGTPAVVAHPWSAAATTIVGSLAADACTRAVLDAISHAGPSDADPWPDAAGR